jgi:CheY-like chemotaxis protein
LTAVAASNMTPVPCRVLVVDDNVDAARTMAMLLELEGYQVECAFDGQQALDCVRDRPPDALLLDIGLPRLDGLEVARRLRAQSGEAARKRLLVAVSGYGRDQDRAQALQAGFDLHFTKPADPEQLLQVLARHRQSLASPHQN